MTVAYEGGEVDGWMSRAKSGFQEHLLEYYQPPGISGSGNVNWDWADVPYEGKAFETIDRKRGYVKKGGAASSWTEKSVDYGALANKIADIGESMS